MAIGDFDVYDYLGTGGTNLQGLTMAQQDPYARLRREAAIGGYTMPAQYRQFMTDFAPQAQGALWNLSDPMQQLFNLGQVQRGGRATAGVYGPTSEATGERWALPEATGINRFTQADNFMRFLEEGGGAGLARREVGGDTPYGTRSDLVTRAREGLRLANDPAYLRQMQGLAGGVTDPRYAQLRETANVFSDPMNTQAMANLIARMRPGAQGGLQYGRRGEAIEATMSNLQARRAREGAEPGTFLNWYLGQFAA